MLALMATLNRVSLTKPRLVYHGQAFPPSMRRLLESLAPHRPGLGAGGSLPGFTAPRLEALQRQHVSPPDEAESARLEEGLRQKLLK